MAQSRGDDADTVAINAAVLKTARRERGFSLNALGAKTGIDDSFLSRLERGVAQRLASDKATELANVLNIPFDELATEAASPGAPNHPEAARQVQDMIRQLQKTAEAQSAIAEQLARTSERLAGTTEAQATVAGQLTRTTETQAAVAERLEVIARQLHNRTQQLEQSPGSMEGLRVVLKNDAPMEDSARILLSIDELYRILAWANLDQEATRSRARSTTWRTVPGLSLRQVRSGSVILDLSASLPPETQVAVVTSVIGILGVLANWIMRTIDPKQRAEVRSLNANTRKASADAREKEIANELAEEMKDVTLWKEAYSIAKEVRALGPVADDDDRALDRSKRTRRPGGDIAPIARLPPALQARLDAILDHEDLGDDLFEQIFEPARRRQLPPSRSLQATGDAALLIRRVEQHQRKSGPVERVEVIDNGTP